MRVAVEGCGHGTLDQIYASVQKSSQIKGWDGVDLLIIGGDFQAVRNADDLTCMSVPSKYLEIGDFHKYYSGALKAPYLTVFVGGNHEASNYLSELFYGGWVAPNIYYLGAANVICCGPLRIAGLSGIWKGYNYKKPHYERIPYNYDDVKSVYHVREVDVRRLMQIRTQVDVGVSHDWPRGVEWNGNYRQLFRCKPGFEEEAKAHQLGSAGAKYVMDRLRPKYWFAAHMHAKFAAVVKYSQRKSSDPESSMKTDVQQAIGTQNSEEGAGDSNGVLNAGRESKSAAVENADEIDLDMDDEEPTTTSAQHKDKDIVDGNARALLPDSFSRPNIPDKKSSAPSVPIDITNTTTRFLALDKCLPKRHFLQLLEIVPTLTGKANEGSRFRLTYDKEWLAISRVFAPDLIFGDPSARIPQDRGDTHYATRIAGEEEWVEEHLVKKYLMNVPQNFEMTAPPYRSDQGINNRQQPKEYTNPQTSAYCKMLEIDVPFLASEEDREERWRRALSKSGNDRGDRGKGGHRGGHRGGNRGRGRGSGRGHR